MHGVLYVCLPRSKARSSLQARKKVCEYLTQENYDDTDPPFSGGCDYDDYSVGGRWSGRLSLLRLQYEQPRQFSRFWKYCISGSTAAGRKSLFQKLFPTYRGRLPFNRMRVGEYGASDDAQIMDEPLFRQLQPGFGEEMDGSYEINEPNVIFAEDGDEFEWPKTAEEGAKFWVVLIDYHF
jgi:hypothetical protein